MRDNRSAVSRLAETQPADACAVVALRDVRFAWSASAGNVVNIDQLDIVPGERVFIAGPSGSGKSTLLSLLGGVVTPQHGTVAVLGVNLAELTGWHRDRFRADHIGFLFQLFNLVPYLSMVDNVTLPCRFSQSRRERAVERSGSLQAEALRLLRQLELDQPALLKRAVTDLSIGQQQRVAAARALIGAPALIIADEPTSALDEGTRERFLELLFGETDSLGTTLLFVSHDTRLGALFSRRIAFADLNRGSR